MHQVLFFFHKHELWRHDCPCNENTKSKNKKYDVGYKECLNHSYDILDGVIQAGEHTIDPDLKKHILCRMRTDSKLSIIKSDDLILKFGASLLKRFG